MSQHTQVCYECLKPTISLSYRSRCVHCEAVNAKANRLENDNLHEQLATMTERHAVRKELSLHLSEQLAAIQLQNTQLREAYVLLENFAQSVGGSSSFWEDMNDKLEPASVIANFGKADTSALPGVKLEDIK